VHHHHHHLPGPYVVCVFTHPPCRVCLAGLPVEALRNVCLCWRRCDELAAMMHLDPSHDGKYTEMVCPVLKALHLSGKVRLHP
jgi:hypothetical protein